LTRVFHTFSRTMSVSALAARRASGPLLRTYERSHSCPDLSAAVARMKLGQTRNLNLMVMHPRAPKIRHLNASHSLLIELEENVKKVQDLEATVLELEKQLQWRELQKKENVIKETKRVIEKTKQKTIISEEEQQAFRLRLEEAKKKAAQISHKRDEEEANIMRDEFRSWHQQKLKTTIDKMARIPESDAEIKMLPQPQEVNTEAILFSDIETLVNMANFVMEPATYKEELAKLEVMMSERDILGKLFTEVQEKEDQAINTINECRNTINSVNAMRIKLNANVNMSKSLIEKMQTLEKQRKTQNIFVYGPNPIFNSAKEMELNYSINNQFVIEMLTELDMSFHVAKQNLATARACRRRYRENKSQILDSLHSLQVSMDDQSQHLTFMQNTLNVQNKENVNKKENVVDSGKMNQSDTKKNTQTHTREI